MTSAFELDDDELSVMHDEVCLAAWLHMPSYEPLRTWKLRRWLRFPPYCRHGVWWMPREAVKAGRWR